MMGQTATVNVNKDSRVLFPGTCALPPPYPIPLRHMGTTLYSGHPCEGPICPRLHLSWQPGVCTTKDCQSSNRNMSKSKGWTLQRSLLMLWMEKTRVNNQTTIDDKWKTY